ncbi:MAG TPA: DUF427 domain-containing protein, partial [Micromonosporaceae bacterium]
EPSGKRVRAYFAGTLVADSLRPLLVWEGPYYPTYYFPAADVPAKLEPTGAVEHSPSRGDGLVHDIVTGSGTASGAARVLTDSPIAELRGTVRIAWDAMDDWFEEDEPVYTHARDPYTRIDILASSRHVRIELDGVTVAETRSPRMLFESHLPTRYYMPITDVRADLLRPSESVTHCPYKGAATYWSLEVNGVSYPDYVWCYRAPLPESQKVAGLACFYNERVDIYVDGVLQDRPTGRH